MKHRVLSPVRTRVSRCHCRSRSRWLNSLMSNQKRPNTGGDLWSVVLVWIGLAGNEYSANSKPSMLINAIRESRRRRLNMQMALHHLISRRRHVLHVCFLSFVVDFPTKKQHHDRWAETVWATYSDARFKKTFRISRSMFKFILNRNGPFLSRQTVIDEPLPPELRFAIHLGRGDYLYTIAEMAGLGVSTVCNIVQEVC